MSQVGDMPVGFRMLVNIIGALIRIRVLINKNTFQVGGGGALYWKEGAKFSLSW